MTDLTQLENYSQRFETELALHSLLLGDATVELEETYSKPIIVLRQLINIMAREFVF